MSKFYDTVKSMQGYDIPVTAHFRGDEEQAVIIIHGFGSSKESPTAKMMTDILPLRGIAAVSFDFPAHGESPVNGDMLRLQNCINDLEAVENYMRENCPNAQIGYFGSSFGAYVTMNYLTQKPKAGAKVLMRSAAVNMPELFRNPTEEQQAQYDAEGFVTLEYESGRALHVYKDFADDLDQHDLFENFAADGAKMKMKMIHGTADETILFDKAKAFADKYGIELMVIEDGDHRLSGPGMAEAVLNEAFAFFASDDEEELIEETVEETVTEEVKMSLVDGFKKYMQQLGLDAEDLKEVKGDEYTILTFGQKGEKNLVYKILLVIYDNNDAVEIYIQRKATLINRYEVLSKLNDLNMKYFGITFYTEQGEIATKSFCRTGGEVEIAIAQMIQNLQTALTEFANFE